MNDDRTYVQPEVSEGVRLNLGCGRRPREGWVNVDSAELPGVDYVVDLDGGNGAGWSHSHTLVQLASALNGEHSKIGDSYDTVDEFYMSHVLEHLHHPLPLMESCWVLAKPGALFTILCPHGASDDADEDPTHVRKLFPGSFSYFAQPTFWRADYGYRGDWQPESVELKVHGHVIGSCTNMDELKWRLLHDRNVVAEMEVKLRAVKPAREPGEKKDMVPFELTVSEAVDG